MRRGGWSLIGGPVAFTVIAHLLLLWTPVGPDEGGYAMVARFADAPGPYLYGPQFVDRPPLLFGLFRLAVDLGPYGTRILATAAAVVCVLACMRAAALIGDSTASRWAGWTAAGLTSSALLLAQQLNGEILGAAVVSTSIVVVLEAADHALAQPGLAFALSALGGLTGCAALLIKQNFVDALVFALVFAVVRVIRRKHVAASTVGGYLLGLVVAALGVLAWSNSHHGLRALLYAMYGIRADASHTLVAISLSSRLQTLGSFLALGVGSGAVVIAFALVVSKAWRPLATPVRAAYLAAAAVEVVGVIGGGAFAQHYLLGLVPTMSVALGVLVSRAADGGHIRSVGFLRVATAFAVTSAALVDPVLAAVDRQGDNADHVIAEWLHRAARRTDSVAVPFTNAQIVELSGLRPGYPFSWSLLVRVRDPDLVLFDRTLASSARPTWIVRWNTPEDLGLHPQHSILATIARHYAEIGTLCGKEIWLVRGRAPLVALSSTCH